MLNEKKIDFFKDQIRMYCKTEEALSDAFKVIRCFNEGYFKMQEK